MFITRYQRMRELRKKMKPRKHYMLLDEKERAIIDVGAENYDDIYSPFCLYDMNVIDFELEDYLDNKNETVPLEYDLDLMFHIKDANEEKRREIETTIKQNYGARLHSINKKMAQNRNISLLMLFFGMLFLVISVYAPAGTPALLKGLLDILSWVFTWSAIEFFFLERKVLQVEKILMMRLMTAKIEVKDFIPKWAREPQPINTTTTPTNTATTH